MNNLFFPRKTNNIGESETPNRAQTYYPEDLNMPENISPQEDMPFDIQDLSQFQQDFSYLQNLNENLNKNDEKIQKNAENIAQKYIFTNLNNENTNFETKNSNFSSIKDNFLAQNIEEKNQNQKNGPKNAINIEKIMNFLKNGSQNDLFSSMLASGIFKNQNPVVVETLSKMLTQKNSSTQKRHHPSTTTNLYEEM